MTNLGLTVLFGSPADLSVFARSYGICHDGSGSVSGAYTDESSSCCKCDGVTTCPVMPSDVFRNPQNPRLLVDAVKLGVDVLFGSYTTVCVDLLNAGISLGLGKSPRECCAKTGHERVG